MIGQNNEAIIVRPVRPVPSRVGRWLAWLSIPWALGVIFGLDAGLRSAGTPPSEQPLLLRVLVLVVALAPGVLAIASPWLGRLPTLGWLLAKPQPEARLDAAGIRLTLPDRPVQQLAWSDVACLVQSNDLRRTNSLIGTDGRVLAKIPLGLVVQRSGGPVPRSLAEAVIAIRPDRYVAAPPSMYAVSTGFAVRNAGASEAPAFDPRRREYLPALTILIFLVVIGAVALIVWVNANP